MGPVAFLLGQVVYAFQPSTNVMGAETSWEVMPVRWIYVDEGRPPDVDREAALTATRRAFDAWNTVPGARVHFIEDLGTTPISELNIVAWKRDWSWDAEILALTTTWSTEEGELVGFRILLNAEDPAWSTTGDAEKMDLQNALTHEVGHALGLAHDDDATATMAATAREGETRKRDLARSDQEGARYLYPAGEAGAACNAAPGAGAHVALMLAVLSATARRRRAA